MSVVPPPLVDGARTAAERAVARAAGVARVSSWVMLVLGGLSALVSLRAPLSAGFAISIAVVVNGWFERHWAHRLAVCAPAAPSRLAINQIALGSEILVYAAWQAHVLGPEQIEAVLRRPVIARFVSALDPEAVSQLLEMLPKAVSFVYWIVGVGTFLGCAATAGYYLSRLRAVRLLAGSSSTQPRIVPAAVTKP